MGTNKLKPSNAGLARTKVGGDLFTYQSLHDADIEARKHAYDIMVDHFYDLVTDFYQFGWGNSFHFAPRRKKESLKASIVRWERYLADELGARPDMKILDIGCGVGGPLFEIARYSGATLVGLNINAYQLAKGRHTLMRKGLRERCSFVRGDFMDIPVADRSFDAAYALEATAHAPDKFRVFSEIFRTLKPGGSFIAVEWCLTDRHDPDNPKHRRLKDGIIIGNGLPFIATGREVVAAIEAAGFEVVAARDATEECDPETPWYRALQGRDISLGSVPRTPFGRAATTALARPLEAMRILPRGTVAVSALLNRAADDLVAAGIFGTFTPLFFVHARRPANLSEAADIA